MSKKKTAPEIASEQDQLSAVVDTLAKQKQGDIPASKTKKQLRAERRAEKARIRSDRALRKKAKKLVIPRTVQETIPYSRVYPDSGIIETADGVFTKTYILEDINYKAAKDEAQDEIYRNYSDFHNSFDSGMVYQITIAMNSASYGIPANPGYCQQWAAYVYAKAGLPIDSSCCAYHSGVKYGVSDDWNAIPPGAAVYGYSGSQYGHVGIYVGNGLVYHNVGGVAIDSLGDWVKIYKGFAWGWLAGSDLTTYD